MKYKFLLIFIFTFVLAFSGCFDKENIDNIESVTEEASLGLENGVSFRTGGCAPFDKSTALFPDNIVEIYDTDDL